MIRFLYKISVFFFLMLFSVNLSAEDFATANLKAFYGYIDSDATYLTDKNHYFFEVETIARQGQWDLYGFTDLKMINGKVNYDFFKYIAKYDVLNNNRLFIVAEAKETFGDHKGSAFIGLGTSAVVPGIGNLNVNVMYFIANEDKTGEKLKLPMMFQLSWFNNFGQISDSKFSIYHGGWSDFDFFEKRESARNRYSFQIYEGVGINYETYATELGYKYWYGMGGYANQAHSVFVYLIKRF